MDNNELVSQWADIKKAYKAIVDNAFPNHQEKQYADYIIIKSLGSAIDLYLTGDENIRKAVQALSGPRMSQNRSAQAPASQQPFPPQSNEGSLPSMPSMPSLFNIGSFMENPAVSSVVNNEELRQLFSFWSMFENNFPPTAPPSSNPEQ